MATFPASAHALDDAGAASRLELLLAGLDLIDQGFTLFDSDLHLVAWNRVFFEMLEFPFELARKGTPFEAFMRYNAERGDYGPGNVEDLVQARVVAAKAFQPHRFERVRPSGQVIEVRGQPIPGRGFVTIYADITTQRRYEKLIREQNSELEKRVEERTAALSRAQAALLNAQKMEAVGLLTGGLAHDFNNMLTVVIGNLLALQERDHSETTASFLEPAVMGARRGVELIRRLLTFARQQPLAPQPVDVENLVGDLVLLLRRSLPESISLDTRMQSERLYALADPNQLESALLNLALNARDAMPDGGSLTISADSQELGEAAARGLEIAPGAYVRVAVADSGTGMDAAILARAFEPFFTTKSFGTGSGLGLSMVYGFVKQSEGAMQLTSEPGKGTVATMFLPATDAAPREIDETPGPVAALPDRRLVLLVEDNPEVSKIVRLQLTDLGHPVIEAHNGVEALRVLETVPDIGILLSDIVMPGGVDGRTLAAQARRQWPQIDILLMTAYEQAPTAELGDFALLPKPFAKRDLVAALQACKR
ncbi:MAG: PAS-domain containing protein [Betaproteobacteria bacterium]